MTRRASASASVPQAAAQVPAAEVLLDVRHDAERGRGPARVGAGVRRVPVEQRAQPRVGEVALAEPAQRAAGRDRAQVAEPDGLPGQVPRRRRAATPGTGRRTASQIRSVRAASRRQSAPAPAARTRRPSGRWSRPGPPAVSSRVPSANRCRISGSSGCQLQPAGQRSPVAANRSAKTSGRVSSDGPVSKRNVPAAVCRSSRPSLPPTTSACSQTVTSWPRGGEPGGGGQPADAGADHDDPAHGSAPSLPASACRPRCARSERAVSHGEQRRPTPGGPARPARPGRRCAARSPPVRSPRQRIRPDPWREPAQRRRAAARR